MRPFPIWLALVIVVACNRNRDKTITAAPISPQPEEQRVPSNFSNKVSKAAHLEQSNQPVPTPPSNSLIQPWLDLKEVPTDLAIGKINISLGSLPNVWLWAINSDKPERFGDRFPMRVGSHRSFDPTIKIPSGFDCPGWITEWETEGLAVYAKYGPWHLIHSYDEGWCWLLLRDEELSINEDYRWSVYEEPWRNVFSRIQNPHPKVDSEGFISYYSIDTIQPMPSEILREQPNDQSKSLGPVTGKYFKMISFRENWVQIQETETSCLTEPKDANGPVVLKVRWNPNRIGWIRWQVPGPIPGTFQIRLRGLLHCGGYRK